jgi:hypothetical protein
MNPDIAWIADYDQRRAVVDECLDGLVKIAAHPTESRTEAFLAVLSAAATLHPEVRAAVIAAAVTRLAKRGPP